MQGADGQPAVWHRCPLAVLAEDPHAGRWAGWAARHFAAFQSGGLSPYEQESRYSAVADQVFSMYARGQADAFRDASRRNDASHRDRAR